MTRPKIFTGQVSGHFKLEAVKADGSRRVVADWFDNLILDQGLNRIGSGPIHGFVQVGSGNNAPTNGDVGLQSHVATTSSLQNTLIGNETASPQYAWIRFIYRFNAGAAAGNLSEVGIGWATGNNLFSRALIRDAEGNPTTITILSDEYLDVTYELRLYPPLTDTTYDIVISGVTYSCVQRASGINGWNVQFLAAIYGMGNFNAFNYTAFEGAIGSLTGSPSGTASGGGAANITLIDYSNNSYERVGYVTIPLGIGNFPTGIGAFRLTSSCGEFQIGFTPKIPKDANKVLRIDFEWSWSRRSI